MARIYTASLSLERGSFRTEGKDRWCPIEYPSIFEGRGDFFQGGCFVRARMEEIDERSIKSDRYSYFYDRTVDDELVWWHSLVEK